jgi:hypothetical protein
LAKHLSDRDIERVVGLLDGWQDKLSWELLSKACLPVIGTVPARQTLHRIVRIQGAFKATKERLRNGPTEIKAPPSMRVAMQRIARLTIENERVTRENSRLLEQFVVWQYNAHVRGMFDSTVQLLNAFTANARSSSMATHTLTRLNLRKLSSKNKSSRNGMGLPSHSDS